MFRLRNRSELYELWPKHSRVLEVGVYEGLNALDILKRAQPRELHLIDNWLETKPWNEAKLTGQEAYAQVVARTADYSGVRLLRGDARELIPKLPEAFFDGIYLDTTHTYENTLRELRLLSNKLKKTGILAGHDYCCMPECRFGVIEAVTEFVATTAWRLAYLTSDEWPSFGLIREDAEL